MRGVFGPVGGMRRDFSWPFSDELTQVESRSSNRASHVGRAESSFLHLMGMAERADPAYQTPKSWVRWDYLSWPDLTNTPFLYDPHRISSRSNPRPSFFSPSKKQACTRASTWALINKNAMNLNQSERDEFESI